MGDSIGRPLRILVVHPGASTSISDVHRGVVTALGRRSDVEIAEYDLGGRLAYQAEWLKWLYRRAKKRSETPDQVPVPTPTDCVMRASRELPIEAWRFNAHWVLVVAGMFLHPDMLALLRWYGRPKVAVLFTESPYDDARQIPLVPFIDVCWTQERSSLAAFRAHNPAAEYLPLAWDPEVHRPGQPDPDVPAHDVVFVGTGFSERIEILEAVDWDGLGIDLGLYGHWEYLGARHRLRRYIRGGQTPNERTAALYRNAKIGLNLFRQSKEWGRKALRIAHAESLNPRAYELAACGVFAVSDFRAELGEVFGDAVPTFRTAAELGPLLRRWLDDEPGRQAIQARLPGLVAAHTYQARVEQIVRDLRAATVARCEAAA